MCWSIPRARRRRKRKAEEPAREADPAPLKAEKPVRQTEERTLVSERISAGR